MMGIDIRYAARRPLKDEDGYVSLHDADDPGAAVTGYVLREPDADATWYHGTAHPDFDEYQTPGQMEGTSFTRDYNTAERYSYKPGGAFAAESEAAAYEAGADDYEPVYIDDYGEPQFENEERGRVIANRLQLPAGVSIPHFEIDPDEWYIHAEDGDELVFWERVHEEAADEARRLGAPAYTIEHMTGLDEMVVLDPNKFVRMAERDVQGEVSILPDRPRPNLSSVVAAVNDYNGNMNAQRGVSISSPRMEYQNRTSRTAYRPRSGRGRVYY